MNKRINRLLEGIRRELGEAPVDNSASVGKTIKIGNRKQVVTRDYVSDTSGARVIQYKDKKGRTRSISQRKGSDAWFGDMPGKGAVKVDLSALGEAKRV